MNNKMLNNLGKMLYDNINLIQNYDIDELLNYKHSGIISLVLKYYHQFLLNIPQVIK